MDWQNTTNKEWRNRDEYLKEFQDALIPSSQSSIDWQESDEDDDIHCLTPLKRCRVDITKSIVKKSNSNQSFRRTKITYAEPPISATFKESNSIVSISSSQAGLMSPVVTNSSLSAGLPEGGHKLSKTFNTLQTNVNYPSNRPICLENSKMPKKTEIIDITDDTINHSSCGTGIGTFSISTSKIMSPKLCKKMYANNYNTNGKVNFARSNLQNVKKDVCERYSINNFNDRLKHIKNSVSKNINFSQPTSPVFNSCKNYKQISSSINVNQQVCGPVLSCKRNIYPEISISDSDHKDSQYVNAIESSRPNINAHINELPSSNKRNGQEIEIVDIVNLSNIKETQQASLPIKNYSNMLRYRDIDSADLKIVPANLIQKDNSVLPLIRNGYNNEPSEDSFKTGFNRNNMRLKTVNHVSCIGEVNWHGSFKNLITMGNNSISVAGNENFNKNCCIEDTESENDFPEPLESSILIDAFSSPISDTRKKKGKESNDNIRQLENEMEEAYDECSLESRYVNQDRTGFEWAKNLNKTPGKILFSCSDPDNQVQQAPDSSKKKMKKEGHADHLRKLIKSWQSDVAMFNHQMAQVNSNLLLTCLDSPIIANHSLPVANININQSPIQPLLVHHGRSYINDIPSLYQSNLNQNDLSYSYNIEKNNFNKLGNIIVSGQNISPKTSQINKLQKLCCSLDVSPASTSSLSSCKSFFVPQRHICLQVTWISTDFLSSETISIECRVTDYCSNAPKNEKTDLSSSFTSSSSGEYVVNSQIDSRNYFVLLNQFGKKISKLQIGDEIKIFAPWEVLEVEKLNMPTIFSSYYVIKANNGIAGSQLTNVKKKIQIASRSCSCFKGHLIPSLCVSGELKLFVDKPVDNKEIRISEGKDFDSVLNKKKATGKVKHHMWTVLEAIEYGGGKPDVLVRITAWIRRVILTKGPDDAWNQIKSGQGQPSQYIIVCQDPSGTFFVICIPNRPLASNLQSLIDRGEGSVQTLSNLLVCHRITNSQDPSLFSLIHSLHISYQMSVECDKNLKVLLADSLKRPLQTFCYKFLVSLGKTEHVVVTRSNGLYFKEQLWSIEEAFSKGNYGQRGKLVVNIYYYIHPYLYVMCQKKPNEEMNRVRVLHRLTVKTGIWLPPWICCDGTIIAAAVLRDILVTRKSGLLIDEYSSIIKLSKEFKVNSMDLLKLTSILTVGAVTYDLVTVEGFIVKVIEEGSFIWLECEFCLEYLPDADMLWCQKCDLKNTTPHVKYSMEIEMFDPRSQIGLVKIRLCQKTIEGLLKTCKLVNNVAYDSSTLHGKRLMPLLCVIKSVVLKNYPTSTVYNLIELPY